MESAKQKKADLELQRKEIFKELRPLQKVQKSIDQVMQEIEKDLDPVAMPEEKRIEVSEKPVRQNNRTKKKSHEMEL